MMKDMRIAVVVDEGDPDQFNAAHPILTGRLQPLAPDGTPLGPPEQVPDLITAMAAREQADHPRWVWATGQQLYPWLLRSGVRVATCHDVALVEALLLARDGHFNHPRSALAAWSRLNGLPVPPDPPPHEPQPASRTGHQQSLFDPTPTTKPTPAPPDLTTDPLHILITVHADQIRRLRADQDNPPRIELLAAAESAGGLAAAEMAHTGLPWRNDIHDALLTDLLGPRPFAQALPRKLAELALRIAAAFGLPPGSGFNPDSPAQVLKAFAYAGVPLKTTRSWEIREVDHPAAALMLEYKELSRIHAANGWAWQDAWVSNNRFRPEYLVGGVVSGRWATHGSGALQLPRLLRRAVIADEGWSLVVADAGQLEPRVLAAMSGDQGLARAAGSGDLYAALADEVFNGDRPSAKIGLLAAMYGQTGGVAAPLLQVMRRRFPAAMAYVESAAQTGQDGGIVRSRLGRTCPPPSRSWRETIRGATTDPDAATTEGAPGFAPDPLDDPDTHATTTSTSDSNYTTPSRSTSTDSRRSAQATRARGRFTRNFVIQASAADWALVLLAVLRRRLTALTPDRPLTESPHLVFFMHDEVVVHTPKNLAEQTAEAVTQAAAEATKLVFGNTPVRFPLHTGIVDCYADAK